MGGEEGRGVCTGEGYAGGVATRPSRPAPLPPQKERDFYFGKLRDIEILLQSYAGPDRATADTIFKILCEGGRGARQCPRQSCSDTRV